MSDKLCDRSGWQVACRLWALSALTALVLVGCGGSESDDSEGGLSDTGTDVSVDAGDEVDGMAGDADASGDVGVPEDADGGEIGDGGEVDVDAGPGCELDTIDTTIDRDRDGLRDECDNFKWLNHGGDNVEEAHTITENEVRWPNDSYLDAEDNYNLDLPVQIEGAVGPAGEDGDLDHYAFEVEKPTAVLIHLEATSDKLWPGGVLVGREDRNRNKRAQLIGPESGENATREVFLPSAGRYVFAVSDVRNLLPDSSPVGGAGEYTYRIHVTTLPLPSVEQGSVPGSVSHEYDKRLHAYKLDTSDVEGLRVAAQGIGLSERSAQNPVINLYDPEAERTLGYTIQQQTDSDRLTVSLTTRLGDEIDEVYVIEDHFSQTGETASKLDFTEVAADSELETIKSPRDGRGDELTWLQPGVEVDGMIGPPRTEGPTELSPDVDYFLYSAKRGQTVRVTVTPEGESQLQPNLEMGHFIARSGGGSDFDGFGGHTVPASDQPGESRSLEYLFTSETDGEVAFRLEHAPNADTDFPVGGEDFEYSIKLEVVEPSPVEISPIPGVGLDTFGPGGMAFYSLDPPENEIIRLAPEAPEGISLDLRGELVRQGDWTSIRQGPGRMEFHSGSGSSFLYSVRDDDGRGTGGENITLEVETQPVEQSGALPMATDGELGSGDDVSYHQFEVSEGGVVDVRLQATNFDGRLAVYSLPNYNQVGQDAGGVAFRTDTSGEYVAEVWSNGSSGGSYRIGAREVSATQPSELPSTQTASLDEPPSADWYKIDISSENFYEFTLETTGSEDFEGQLDVFDPWDMTSLASGGDGTRKVRPGYDGQLYAVVYDSEQNGGADYDYTLTIRERKVEDITPGQPETGQLADGRGRMLYLFDTGGGGAVDVEVTTEGAWTPQVELVEQGSLDPIENVEPHNGEVRYASSESGSYAVWVEAYDPDRSGPLEFTIDVQHHSMNGTTGEGEPNDSQEEAKSLEQFPAVVEGSLGPTRSDTDNFGVQLQSGQRIWMLPIPEDPTKRYRLRPTLSLIGPGGRKLADNRLDGYGWFPALHARQVPSSGTWNVRLSRWQGQTSGNYFLYVFRGPAFDATESEPNDDRSNAQDIGEVGEPARIEASVDDNDPVDVYRFDLRRDVDTLRIFLENAEPGHNLVLTNDAGDEVAAGGPAHGGSPNPLLTPSDVEAGTYYLEVGQGNGGGALDVIMWPEP